MNKSTVDRGVQWNLLNTSFPLCIWGFWWTVRIACILLKIVQSTQSSIQPWLTMLLQLSTKQLIISLLCYWKHSRTNITWCPNIWAASWQNQQNDLCTQQRLRSAWASAQSDQSLLFAQWVAKDPSFLHAASKDGGCPGWYESLLGAKSFCWFCHVAAHF